MLTFDYVTVRYRPDDAPVIQDISFDLQPGETLAVIGRSGAGKTTIGRLACGLQQPTCGRILLQGVPLAVWRQREPHTMQRVVQMVFQDVDGSLPAHLPVGVVLRDALKLAGIRGSHATTALERLFAEMELPPHLAHHRPRQLSGGQRQRVALARAFAAGPRIVVLDEPTASLDAMLRWRLLDVLQRYQERHAIAYLFITHDLELVRSVASRVLILEGGVVVERGTPETLLAVPQHPATRRLVAAIPSPDPQRRRVIAPHV